MPIYYKRPAVLNSDAWTAGSGDNIGVFNYQGSLSENMRVNSTNPFGGTSVIWSGMTDGGNTADGGFSTTARTLDNTKLYRFSVWMRRTSSTATGSFYFGCGYGSPNNLLNVSDGSVDTNPYWYYSNIGTFTQNTWYLFVGHIFPYNYVPNIFHPNSGVWTIANGKLTTSVHEYKFQSTTLDSVHRSFLYYGTNAADSIGIFDPRIQLCDGSEGTIESLLTNDLNNKLGSLSITKDGASFKHQKVVATGGNTITDCGQWRIHTFTGSSSFNVSSYVGSGLAVDYLIVAGGGGTGYDVGGGGGGGGVITGSTILTGTTYTITIGGGGGSGQSGGTPGSDGSNSTFNGLTATGGGGGGAYSTNKDGRPGGSGGGGGAISGAAGTGTSGQGFNGGTGAGTAYGSGGGGGAGGVGAAGVANTQVLGGIYRTVGINGRPIRYSGGGYGNSDGGYIAVTGQNAQSASLGYYGFGANGTGSPNASPYSGNGGIVIIRYKIK